MGYAYFALNFGLDKLLSSGFDVDSHEKPMINGDFALTSLEFGLIALLGFCDYTFYLAFLELGIHESVRVCLDDLVFGLSICTLLSSNHLFFYFILRIFALSYCNRDIFS